LVANAFLVNKQIIKMVDVQTIAYQIYDGPFLGIKEETDTTYEIEPVLLVCLKIRKEDRTPIGRQLATVTERKSF